LYDAVLGCLKPLNKKDMKKKCTSQLLSPCQLPKWLAASRDVSGAKY
jgi:hypothetical protein